MPYRRTHPSSTYAQHRLEIDGLLGDLGAALEQAGAWDSTYVILSSDHGMGQSASSDHPPSTLSSWKNVMYFYGPGVKKGGTIPYAETPDAAVLAAHLPKLAPLQGHTESRSPSRELRGRYFRIASRVSRPRYPTRATSRSI
jgi:hypothetical protein